jgi:hypothetical protein
LLGFGFFAGPEPLPEEPEVFERVVAEEEVVEDPVFDSGVFVTVDDGEP